MNRKSIFLRLSIILAIFSSPSLQVTDCQRALVTTLQNTSLLLKQVYLSGKYFNELGNYNQCQFQEDNLEYALAVLHNDITNVYDTKYVWGFCISENCTNTTSLLTMDSFLKQSASVDSIDMTSSSAAIEYFTPHDALVDTQTSRYVVLWVLIVIVAISFFLGIFGIVVEYTSIGNLNLSHEETNFNQIDIPMIQEGNTKDQLKQIMMIKDELLRNSKKLWASIVLCFSFTRNLRHLFFKFKITSDKMKHRNALYFVMFFGFIWHIIFSATYVGIITYPKNIFTLPNDLAQIMYVINHGGQLFGLNLIFFSYGYLLAVTFLNYANFIPKEFTAKRRTQSATRENSQSFASTGKEESTNIEQVNIGGEDCQNKYYIKRQNFVFLVNVFRKYFRLFVPIMFATLFILYALPFLSDGPIYLAALRTQFLIPCEYGWYLNLTFIQNLLYWDPKAYNKSNCNSYIANGVTSSSKTKISDSYCQYTCGQYLQVFSNLLQFFIFCPFILYLHKYFRRASYFVIIIMILCSTGVTFAIVLEDDIQPYMFFDTQYITYLLHRPWFRLPCFLVGLLLGLICQRIHAMQIQISYDKYVRLIFYFIGIVITWSIMLILQLNNNCYTNVSLGFNQKGCFTSFESALYTSLAPLVFMVGVIFILVPTITEIQSDKGSFGLKALLMYDGWRILHKLTVTAFICHYIVIFWYYASTHSSGLILCKWNIARVAYGTLVLAYIFGFVYYLLLDKPIRNIDRLVLFPTKISDSFLVKRQHRSKPRKERKLQLPDDKSGGPGTKSVDLLSDVHEESVVSDESEDEDTTTLRRAQKIMENSRTTENYLKGLKATSSSYNPNNLDRSSFLGSHEKEVDDQMSFVSSNKVNLLAYNINASFNDESYKKKLI